MTGERAALWALLFGNFVIGTGVLLPAGLINPLASDLGISTARAGLLITIGGMVVGIGAPLFAALTSAIDRRRLLATSMLLYAVGHAASALVPDFASLGVLRGLTVVAAAIFTPQAAAAVSLLVPPDKRAAAIAMIFIGWSAASVIGIPLSGLIAEYLGWRTAYLITSALSLLSLLWVWATLPPGLKVQPLSFESWRKVLTSPALMLVILVTLASLSGQFVVFGYLAPLFKTTLGAGAETIALLFAVYGGAAVAGNSAAATAVGRFGVDRSVLAALLMMVAGLSIAALSAGSYAVMALGLMAWGLGSFSANSLQQSRLATLAPALASASIALNTSAIYLGQAIGAGIGAKLITGGIGPAILWSAAALVGLAAALSIAAARRA